MLIKNNDQFELPLNQGSCSIDHIPRGFAHLKLIHVNARDMRVRDKMAELSNIARLCNAEIIAVSETFLSTNDSALYNIDGYEHLHHVRLTRGGGGVSIFVHHSFTVISSVSHSAEDQSVQLLLCLVQRRTTRCYMAAFYSNCRGAFHSLLALFATALRGLRLPVFLLGDSNVNTLSSDVPSLEYLSTISSLGLLPIIKGITRVESGTCLDHIFVPAGTPVVEVQSRIVLTNVISDHYPVWAAVCLADGLIEKSGPILRRIFSSRNFSKFYTL